MTDSLRNILAPLLGRSYTRTKCECAMPNICGDCMKSIRKIKSVGGSKAPKKYFMINDGHAQNSKRMKLLVKLMDNGNNIDLNELQILISAIYGTNKRIKQTYYIPDKSRIYTTDRFNYSNNTEIAMEFIRYKQWDFFKNFQRNGKPYDDKFIIPFSKKKELSKSVMGVKFTCPDGDDCRIKKEYDEYNQANNIYTHISWDDYANTMHMCLFH